jgi:hypothetical protein
MTLLGRRIETDKSLPVAWYVFSFIKSSVQSITGKSSARHPVSERGDQRHKAQCAQLHGFQLLAPQADL